MGDLQREGRGGEGRWRLADGGVDDERKGRAWYNLLQMAFDHLLSW